MLTVIRAADSAVDILLVGQSTVQVFDTRSIDSCLEGTQPQVFSAIIL